MQNYIQEGHLITITAPAGDVTSDDGVVIGACSAGTTAAVGETVTTGVMAAPVGPKIMPLSKVSVCACAKGASGVIAPNGFYSRSSFPL